MNKTLWNLVASVVTQMQDHYRELDKAWGSAMSSKMLVRAFALQLVAMRIPQLEIDAAMAEAREFLKPTMGALGIDQPRREKPQHVSPSMDPFVDLMDLLSKPPFVDNGTVSPMGGGKGPFGSAFIEKLVALGSIEYTCGRPGCPGTLKRERDRLARSPS